MEVIKTDSGMPIFSWCPDIEEEALNLMKNLMSLPFVRYGALMPDSHHGTAAPIGSVIACDNVVIPWAVGSDCSCGMGVIKTSLKKSQIEDEGLRKKLHHSFSRSIPVGFAHNSQKRINDLQNRYVSEIDKVIEESNIVEYELHNPVGNYRKEFAAQLGTLGGG